MPFFGYRPTEPSAPQDGVSMPGDQAKYPGQSFIGPSDQPAPEMTPAQEEYARLAAAQQAASYQASQAPANPYTLPDVVLPKLAGAGQDLSAGAEGLRQMRTGEPLTDAFKTVGAGILDTASQVLGAPQRIKKGVDRAAIGDAGGYVDVGMGALGAANVAAPFIGVAFNTFAQPGTLTAPLIEKAAQYGGKVVDMLQRGIAWVSPDYAKFYDGLGQAEKDEMNGTIALLAAGAAAHGAYSKVKTAMAPRDLVAATANDVAGLASRQADPALRAQMLKDLREIHPDLHQDLPAPARAELDRATGAYNAAFSAGDAQAMAASKARAVAVIAEARATSPKADPADLIKRVDEADKALSQSAQPGQDVSGPGMGYQKEAAKRAGVDLTEQSMPAARAAEIARELAPRDVKVTVVPEIAEGGRVSAGEFVPGEKPEIRISDRDARKTTAVHEVTHAALAALRQSDSARHAAVFEAAKKDFGTQDARVVEERLAEESAYYFEKRSFKSPGLSGVIKDFIRRMWLAVRARVGGPLRRLYHDVATGKFRGEYASTRGKEMSRRMQEVERPKGEAGVPEKMPLPKGETVAPKPDSGAPKSMPLPKSEAPEATKVAGEPVKPQEGGKKSTLEAIEKLPDDAAALEEKARKAVDAIQFDRDVAQEKADAQKMVERIGKMDERAERKVIDDSREAFANDALAQLNEAIKDVASPADRTALLKEAKLILREVGTSTEKVNRTARIVDLVTRKLESVRQERRDLTKKYRALLESGKFDARVRQEFADAFGESFTAKKLTAKAQEYADLSAKVDAGTNTPAELTRFMELSEDGMTVSEFMGKKSIWQMGTDELAQLRGWMEQYEQEGSAVREMSKTAREQAAVTLASQLEREAVKSDTPVRAPVAMDKRGLERLGAKLRRAGLAMMDSAGAVKEEFTPSVWLAEKYGLEGMDKALQEADGKASRATAKTIDEMRAMEKRLGIDERSAQRVAWAGTAAQGGVVTAKLVNTLLARGEDPFTGAKISTQEQALARVREMADVETFLDENERAYLDAWRKVFRDELPALREYKAVYENEAIRSTENYVPTVADLRTTRAAGLGDVGDFDADMSTSLGQFRRQSADASVTKGRTAMANALSVDIGHWYGHVRDAQYLVNVGPALKTAADAISRAKDKLGSHGVEVAKDMLDTYARRGKLGEAPGPMGKAVQALTRGSGAAVLSMNPVSYAMQLSSYTDWLATEGKAPVKFVLPGSAAWKEVHEKSSVLEFRDVGDFVAEAMSDEGLRLLWDKVARGDEPVRNLYLLGQKLGFMPFNVIDQMIGTAGWKMVYDDAVKAGVPEDEAVYQADKAVRKTMSSPRFNDNARGILRYRRGATAPLVQFQTFVVNKMSMFLNGGGADAKAKISQRLQSAGVPKEKADALAKGWVGVMAAVLTAGLLAMLVENYLRDEVGQMVGKKPNEDSFGKKLASQAAGYVPVLNQVVGQAKYGGQLWTSWAKYFERAATAYEKGDSEKAGALGLVGLSQMAGLPTTNLVKYALADTISAPASRGATSSLRAPSGSSGRKLSGLRMKKFRMKKLRAPKLKKPKKIRFRKLKLRP